MLARCFPRCLAAIASVLLVAGLVSCKDGKPVPASEWFGQKDPAKIHAPDRAKPQIVFPPHIEGTVAQFAQLVSGGHLVVEGYGLVIHLGKNGSREVPPNLRVYLNKMLARHKFGWKRANMADLTPDRLMRDLDTAVVRVAGIIPPGAPKGSRFDLAVTALESTSTRSLAGGVLMPMDLHLSIGGTSPVGGGSRVLANGSGELFTNPYLDPNKPTDLAKLRRARVLHGGVAAETRPVVLQLRQPDYAVADLIQRRINGRFAFSGTRVAKALNKQMIRLTVPTKFRGDYVRFLELIMHLPVRTGSADGEVNAHKIAKAMDLPTARHEDLALVWEAMGRHVQPIVTPLYKSTNPLAAYYSARTGLRFGDTMADDIILGFARRTNSPLQIPAIRELGHHPRIFLAVGLLEKLLDDPNARVRVAAYEALRERGDSNAIQSIDVAGKFRLDVVRSKRDYVIYATRSGAPRIVLFGRNMPIARPVFFLSPGELVQVHANGRDDRLSVRRKITGTSSSTDPARIEPWVRRLVEVLGDDPGVKVHEEIAQPTARGDSVPGSARPAPSGSPPVTSPTAPPEPAAKAKAAPKTRKVREATGLALTYGEVVTVLAQMCKAKCIPAKFILQEAKFDERIHNPSVTTGRPDMPGQ